MRGFKETAAATVVAEIGDFTRFAHPQQLMSYAGLVPRESSSGNKVWRGAITKTGNPCLRWILTESAWSYRYKPSVSASMAKRMEGLSPHVQAIAWKAQNRLHRKYMRLLSRGKSRPVALMAVARELLGFIWAIAQQVSHESNGSAGLVA
ncbi:MAG: IS110 family transposase [Candidatus Cloacimonetes bacterium]|nr:IS110 family transposase [Candidatus Cloacimonadota bacterium]